ncbi:sugar-binding transcriptional regulator [Microbacterium sp. KUDC0406]|uniref:sugar-binding transcriptional regulator n=1 Tax=Microbacterium sp. KUDC0406 TaxID=2909588 RepID=UPI001F2745F5|nr:sugar-binding domain-containing protein [Microbacterium sp. KUDC0406]UJP11191.1 sugar-binding transcriptional regulator [Microbacterium sp. KUDC0406]
MTDDVRDPKGAVVLRAAQMYYLQDMTMDAIARELRTSRSSVSRLLSSARSTGLVEISIRAPQEQQNRLEETIRHRYGIAAHVVATPQNLSDVERFERIAMTAARILPQYVDSNMIVGIAWGTTLDAISRHLVHKETHNTVFVQLNGAGNTFTSGVDYASEILQRFGRAFDAGVQQFPVPAIFDRAETKQAMWQERSTRRILDLHHRADLVLFGLGSPFGDAPSRVYAGGYLDRDDYRTLREDRVIGDIATVFYREDGTWDGIGLNERASGPALPMLKRVARRIAVASGLQKLPSLQGAIRAGLITDLVLDESLAEVLVG